MTVAATPIKSGWFERTGQNVLTPTGEPKKIAIDNPYITKDEFVNSFEAASLGITASSPAYQNGALERKILQASSWVNRHCRRYFDTQTIDETKTGFVVRPYNPQLVTNVLSNRPYQSIQTIFIQVLRFFIQIDTSGPNNYLQEFPDLGYYKIVPLLSNSGTGAGSPMPAQIVDRVSLGVLWTRYTFGYGQQLTGQGLNPVGTSTTVFQAPETNRLWAPDQTLNVYANSVLQTSGFTVDFVNGKVTFASAPTGPITVDAITNESLPADIKEATVLMTAYMIAQAQANPIGADSWTIQTVSMNLGEKNQVLARAEMLLDPFVNKMFKIV